MAKEPLAHRFALDEKRGIMHHVKKIRPHHAFLFFFFVFVIACLVAWFGFPEGNGSVHATEDDPSAITESQPTPDASASEEQAADTSATETTASESTVDETSTTPTDESQIISPDTNATPETETSSEANESSPTSESSSDTSTDIATTTNLTSATEDTDIPILAVSIVDDTTSELLVDAVNVLRHLINAVLGTDKADYAPTDAVIITGSGLEADASYDLDISSTDDPPVDADASVTADSDGNFIYIYQLDGNYRPNYQAVLKDFAGVVVASIAFTDSRSLSSATLNGGSSTTVSPSDTITAVVYETNTNGSSWHSTGWRVSTSATSGGTSGCYNNTNHDSNGSYNESFSIAAPTSTGTYNAYFIAYSDDSCSSGASATFTITGGVVVSSKPDLTIAKTNNTDNVVNANSTFNWIITVTNAGDSTASFSRTQTILQDSLPNSDITYGTPIDAESGGASSNVSCSINSDTLTCKSSNSSSVTIPVNGTITVTIPATPSSGGTLANPRSGSGNVCEVDPNNNISESSESNNSCSDTVTVNTRTTESATLNGATSVSVAPGASITAVVTGVLSGGDWEGTEWKISATSPESMTCADTSDVSTDGSHTKTFTITAPSTPGTYNAYFRINGSDSCRSDNQGTLLTMTNAVVVVHDTTPPSAAGTPGAATPTNDATPKISWTAATDNIGVDHYVLYWSTVSGGETHNSGSIVAGTTDFTLSSGSALTEGTWYFKIKTYDAAGNFSVSAVGSILVDLTVPDDPDDAQIISTSNIIETASQDGNITMAWPLAETTGGAHDALSGIAGYSYSFTHNATDEPDHVIDLSVEATGVTGDALADGDWYFHLSTVDKAGNWTNTRHKGWYRIDRSKPGTPRMNDADATSISTIVVSWTDKSNNEDYFTVERKGGSDASYVPIYTQDSLGYKNFTGHTYHYTDNSLSCDTQYTYRVRAHKYGTDIYSDYSNTETARTMYMNTDWLSDLTPATVAAGQTNVPIMGFTLTSCRAGAKIQDVTATYTGSRTSDISRMKLYRETSGSGFDSSDDSLLASDATPSQSYYGRHGDDDHHYYDSKEYNLDITHDYTIGAGTATFYLVADVADTATVGHHLDAEIKAGDIEIYPDNPSGSSQEDWPPADFDPNETHTSGATVGNLAVTIDSGPSGNTVTSTNAVFTFFSNILATFKCILDGGGLVSCLSPASYSELTAGSHTFTVQATDGGDHTADDSRTWNIIGATTTPNNVSNLVDDGYMSVQGSEDSADSVTALVDITFEVPVSDTVSTVFIPAGAVIQSSDGEPLDVGILSKETPTAGSLSGLGVSQVVAGAIQWGIPGTHLSFSQAITISIYVGSDYDGQTLPVYRSENTDSGWEQFTSCKIGEITSGYCTFQTTVASYFAVTKTVASATTVPNSGGLVVYGCTDRTAVNYNPYAIYLAYPGQCVYAQSATGTKQFGTAAADILSCSTSIDIKKSIRYGAQNDSSDVKLLQKFLNTYENAALAVDGVYSKDDYNAVVKWQEKYAAVILKPWGITTGTGYVFTQSLKKMKQIHAGACATKSTNNNITPTATAPTSTPFARDLKVGYTGADVKALQAFLNSHGYVVAASGIGSSGQESTFFGPATANALAKFQKANNIYPASGYFGPMTRNVIDKLK